MDVSIFDDRTCGLGEGPLWHPLRQQFFWFDILAGKLLSRSGDQAFEWNVGEHASAAGWIDHDTLLIATDTGLYRYGLNDGAKDRVASLEADIPQNRANDGRADPHGGFWIGTMGKKGETDAGALYRYYRGELRQLAAPMTTPNAICFARSGELAYFTDSNTGLVMCQSLDHNGWPLGDANVFFDAGKAGIFPDGAIIDVAGNMWLADWDGGQVICLTPKGAIIETIDLPVKNTTCPAFGGPNYSTLFVTSAWDWIKGDTNGMTFAVQMDIAGVPECRVDLG